MRSKELYFVTSGGVVSIVCPKIWYRMLCFILKKSKVRIVSRIEERKKLTNLVYSEVGYWEID